MNVFDPELTPFNNGRLIAIEASAGSGKTYTIERLVARLLQEEIVPAGEIVVVTFTKAAAAELRARIRQHLLKVLREAEDAAGRHADVIKLRQHLADFSQIRISTIHGFAQRTLASLGEPVKSLEPAINTDEFRKSLRADVLRNLPLDDVRAITGIEKFDAWLDESLKVLMDNPAAEITAVDANDVTSRIADVTRLMKDALEKRKSQLGVTSYDDLLTRLAVRLANDDDRDSVASTIGALLIDEFQDTDALQWQSFRRIAEFGHLKAFVVVGDPKQAIYGFRGGDVQVYQEALRSADTFELVRNYRSTTNFIEAENLFFERMMAGPRATVKKFATNFGVNFDGLMVAGGDVMPAHIDFTPVSAAGKLSQARELGPSWRFRRVLATKAAEIRQEAFDDVPRVVAGLLGELIPDESRVADDPTAKRPVELDDIVILITKNDFATLIADNLSRVGIPSTVLGGNNVFASDAARHWGYLLRALASPSEVTNVRLFAYSWFGGASRAEVAEMRDDEPWLARFQQHLLDWRSLFNEHRAVFFDTVIEESDILTRATQRPLAERHITDILHVAEVLRSRSSESLMQLVEFLDESAGTDDGDNSNTDATAMSWARRVESDEKTVRIMTVHKAKGLEFPIVLIPYLSDRSINKSNAATYRIMEGSTGRTILDVTAGTKGVVKGAKPPRQGPVIKSHLAVAEQRRKGYVAMTRAKVMNIIWTWAGATDSPLFRDADDVTALSMSHPEHFEVQIVLPSLPAALPALASVAAPERVLARMTRVLDIPPRQHSYTALSSCLRTEGAVLQQEADTEPDGSDGAMTELPTPDFVELASSAQVGRVIHHVMEYLDFTAPDRPGAIDSLTREAAVSEGLEPSRFPIDDAVTLVQRAIETSLGDIAQGRTLSDFAGGRIVPELGFDFSIPHPQSFARLHSIITSHLVGDPTFHSWVESLVIDDTTLLGTMTGSLDAVLSWADDDEPRFIVVDYKTNRLRNNSGLEEYSDHTMTAAMMHNHYFLQALIYVVALHRYLRGRLREYRYVDHIAGAAYLFVRGMDPAQPGSGVLAMHFPEALVHDVSDFFEGRSR